MALFADGGFLTDVAALIAALGTVLTAATAAAALWFKIKYGAERTKREEADSKRAAAEDETRTLLKRVADHLEGLIDRKSEAAPSTADIIADLDLLEGRGEETGGGDRLTEAGLRVKASGVGKDYVGNRLGTQAAAINAALTERPQTAEAVAERAGLKDNVGRVRDHLKWLQKKGLAEKEGGGYRLTAEGVKVQAGTAAVPPPGEDDAVNQLPDDLKRVYLELKRRVTAFGPDIQTYATTNNLIFRAAMNFAEITLRKRDGALRILVRPEGFDIEEGKSAQVLGVNVTRVPDTHLWTLNHLFMVDGNSDLHAVTKLLRQSYEAVRAWG
jgi:hypothetical protein